MIEHPFQIYIIVLNKCTFTPWQAYQTPPASQKKAIRSHFFKGNGKKDDGAGAQSAEDTSDLALFTEMTQKTSKPNDSAPSL